MPQSGWPMENIFRNDEKYSRKACEQQVKDLYNAIETAQKHGLLIEWLECFVGAWNESKDVNAAISAGLIEWDM